MKDNVFSISCWLQDSSKNSSALLLPDLQEDLEVVLMRIEALLVENGSSWENIYYSEKCRYGVPSQSTIELPLLLVGLGRAYIEVLVANDPTKKVLHVQSISCWAPSWIGPYSQATLHNEILHMAGQLGLTQQLCCSVKEVLLRNLNRHWKTVKQLLEALTVQYLHQPWFL
ncbi:hypothetical protein KY285_005419 [Solanum tuberosum]|nr:hypothetical protein KY284_005629 [Solanum tuberosum]KAH0752271.1 hypothetical protein KY285_005419 [Solanum tuberosum]